MTQKGGGLSPLRLGFPIAVLPLREYLQRQDQATISRGIDEIECGAVPEVISAQSSTVNSTTRVAPVG